MELINNYQVPEGYKKTEIGVIPEDWDVVSITKATSAIFLGLTAKVDYVNSGGIPLIRATDIASGRLKFSDARTISVRQHKELTRYRRPKKEDVLVSKSGSLGVCAIVDVDRDFSIYESIIVIQSNSLLNSNFLLWLVRDERTQIRIIWEKVGSTVGHLNLEMFRKLLIPLPPLREQKAIAQTLSDVDALIAALDKLIVKKRHIKTGTMQQLLTGKTRLPGVRGEWEIKKVGTLGSTYGGLTGKKKSDFGNGLFQYITFLNIMNNIVIDTSILEKVNIKKNENQNAVKKNDLFFNTSSETPEEVGMCSILTEEVADVYLNSFCFGFRLEDNVKIDGLYLTYFFRSDQGRNLIYSLAQGATRYNLSKTNFLKLSLNLPLLPEQKAIAQVLSDMDKEITALEKRRTKTQAIKQGMMQELLTGKTRLI